MSTLTKFFIAVISIVCLVVPIVILCDKEKELSDKAQAVQKTEWTSLGTPSDGSMSGTAVLMKRTDPDTGATIYVLVGMHQGSIFVLPPQEKK